MLVLFHQLPVLSFRPLFFEERLDANSTCFRPEMSPQSICSGKSPATPPVLTRSRAKFTLADKFLLAAVEAFVAFAIVLSGERFATDGTHEWSLIGMCSQVGAQVIGSSEAFRAESALESGRVLLDSRVGAGGGSIGPTWVRQIQDIIT